MTTGRVGEPSVERLARAACALELAAVPDQTRAHAVDVIADTIGVMVGGGRSPEVAALATGEKDPLASDGSGRAQLVTRDERRADAATAAFVNATAGTFLELDEGVRPTGHPAIHVVPAALAAAQTLGRSGAELLLAVLSGYEVAARLYQAYRLRYPVHPHGNLAAVGAAVAVSRLCGSDPAAPAAIAATLPLLAVWQPTFEGATVRNAYTGFGAAVGVLANRMAAAGFSGSAGALPAAFGEVAGELVDPGALDAPVDPSNLWITHDYMKVYSACALSHSAIDAVLSLGPIDAGAVRSIEVVTVPNSLKLDHQPRENDLSTRFSLPYAVATAIVNGHAHPSAFTPEPRAMELARAVTVYTTPELENMWPERNATRVVVHLDDDERSATVDNPPGHESRRLTADDLREKFTMLVTDPQTGRERVNHTRLLDLESLPSVTDLLSP
jgi:2-methylcitrate dehydratase PrpD